MTGWVVLWEYIVLWLLNFYLKGNIKCSIKHSRWNHNYSRAKFYNTSLIWLPGTHAYQYSAALFDKTVVRKATQLFFFTINFIETVKLIKEKFTPLKEYTSYFLREETMAYLLSEVLVPAIVPGHRRCSPHSWWKTSHTSWMDI